MLEREPEILEIPRPDEFRNPGAGAGRPASSGKYMLASWQWSSLAILAAFGAWWLVTWAGLVAPLYLPGPAAVFGKLIEVARDGYMDASLWQHLQASILRVLAALFLALATAIPLGLALGLNRVLRALIDPLIEFYRPIPPLAYLPLIVIWFGIGEVSKILLIYLAIFAPIVVATTAGVMAVDPIRIRVAQSLGATRLQLVRFVVLPSALPTIMTGIRIALGAGWSTLVAAELIAATRGLGFMIQSASQFLITDLVIAGILVVALVAVLIEIALRRLQHRFSPWSGRGS
ncbi:MAG: taurine transporter permease [Gammaproteobacteria bacterium]|nr:taurine transporter permease [Gammaproteobacteria bacterium]